VDPAPKASGAFREGDSNSLWGRSPEKQKRAVRRAQGMDRSGAGETRGIRWNQIRLELTETGNSQVQVSGSDDFGTRYLRSLRV